MTAAAVDVSNQGKIVEHPAFELSGTRIVVRGRWLKVAAVYDESWAEDDRDDLPSMVLRLKTPETGRPRADVFTSVQRLPETTPRYGYPMVLESVAAIKLVGYEEWMKTLCRDARTDVRKAARRGVMITVAAFDERFVNGIVGIYNESPVRQGRPFWHYGKAFEAVKRENATYLDRSAFLGAYLGGELIGFVKIVRVRDLAVMMQILSKSCHYDKRVSNALIAKAVEYCTQNGLSYLTYGKFRYHNEDSSLTRFKHRAGFEEFLVPRFFVPLTAKGGIWVRAGLHRDITNALPPWMISGLKSVRRHCAERFPLGRRRA